MAYVICVYALNHLSKITIPHRISFPNSVHLNPRLFRLSSVPTDSTLSICNYQYEKVVAIIKV